MDGVSCSTPLSGQKRGISGSTIKIIAVIAMLIDHVGAVVLERVLAVNGFWGAMGSQNAQEINKWMMENGSLYFTYWLLRFIGRLGFPIFCFLLVEGFQKTRNVKKYALRMGMFALISEVPFNLALTGKLLDQRYQNVYFTLFLGLAALCVFGFLGRFKGEKRLSRPVGILLMAGGVLFPGFYLVSLVNSLVVVKSEAVTILLSGIFCGGVGGIYYLYGRNKVPGSVQVLCGDMTALIVLMLLADFLRTDYGGMGVLTIAVMYAFRKGRVRSMLAGCIVLTIMSVSEVTAFLTLIPVALYNGRRGLKMKYFFYAFYPAHLLLLYLTAVLLGLENVGTFM